MVTVVRYNAGNVLSVTNALTRLGAKWIVSDDEKTILSSDHVIFPGVGSAKSAMEYLNKTGLAETLKKVQAPFLGICLGQQLMASFSEEGNVPLLSIFDARVSLFNRKAGDKVPQIGWNTIKYDKDNPLFFNLSASPYCYFVHSYYVPLCSSTSAVTDYAGVPFSAALTKGNFNGVQFHPEKSGEEGSRLLKNFLELKC
jgi:imidazole glycerol phosphate synthase, glutamine amidotransferase subunit